MRITAAVVNHDTSVHLAACLDALLAQDHPDLDIVVVDNASRDGVEDVLRRYEHRVRVVRNRVNRGYAGALNDVVAATPSDAVLFCNPDVVAAPDHVRLLADALAADPARGSVQGKLLRPDGTIDSTGHVALRARLFRNRGEGHPDAGAHDEPGPVFGVTGALALHRVAMLRDVAVDRGDGSPEVLDEDLFAYFEDVDLDWRAQLRGWTAWYEPRAVATHLRRGIQAGRSVRVEELNWRNRLLVVLKCDHLPSLAAAGGAVAATTALKTLVAARRPAALGRAVRGLVVRVPRMLRKRREVRRRAAVPPADVVATWFEPFSYRDWFTSFRRRLASRRR